MWYLEQIEASLKSIDPLSLKRGVIVWRWSNWIVSVIWKTSTGIQIVLKETSSPEIECRSFYYQLALLEKIWEKLPEYRNSLPQVFWILKRTDWKALGIIMERFSEDNSANVSAEWNEVALLKWDLQKIWIREIDDERIYPSLFIVWWGIKLWDLNLLIAPWILRPNNWTEQEMVKKAVHFMDWTNYEIRSNQLSQTRYFQTK